MSPRRTQRHEVRSSTDEELRSTFTSRFNHFKLPCRSASLMADWRQHRRQTRGRTFIQEDNRSLGKECSSINISVSRALHDGSDHAMETPPEIIYELGVSNRGLRDDPRDTSVHTSTVLKSQSKTDAKKICRTAHAIAHRATCDTRPRERDRNRSHYLSLPSSNLRQYGPIVAPPDALIKHMRRMPLHSCKSGFWMELFCSARMSHVSW